MQTIAIGPRRNLPSWNWIGPDTAAELSRYFRVKIFDESRPKRAWLPFLHRFPGCDLAIFVKRPPKAELVKTLLHRGTRMLYLPVDHYLSPAEILTDEQFLRACSAVLLHCDRLRPYFDPFVRNIGLIDHHNKFGLRSFATYKKTGPILWVGAFQNAPYVLKWAETARPGLELVILSDHVFPGPRKLAVDLAKSLGLEMVEKSDRLNGHRLIHWSPETQAALLASAKAAIDIKAGPENFNQHTKPPTKSQKYIASGLPFATNRDGYAFEYFRDRGLALAVPEDRERWYSEDYWKETAVHGAILRDELSMFSVGRKFKAYIDAALASSDP